MNTTTITIRRAFTLVEILITVVVMAIVVGVAVPSLSSNDRARLVGAVGMVASDLEFAQSVALADPSDPGVFKARPDGTGYWIATASDTATPILSAYSNDPYSITFGTGIAAELTGVTIGVAQASDEVQFDGFGRIAGMADITVTVTNASGSMDIIVKATTGVVNIQ